MEGETLRRGAYLALFVLMALQIFALNSEGNVGYRIDVNVTDRNGSNLTHWSRSQSTLVMSFSSESICTGRGNFSRYEKVQGLAGVGLMDTSSARKGRLISKSTLNIASDLRALNIQESVTNNATHYSAKITEDLPTYISNNDDIYYNGEGIRTRTIYTNNKDRMSSEYQAKTFIKNVKYAAIFRSNLVSVDIVPGSIKERILSEYSTGLLISSDSDQYSRLRFSTEGLGSASGDYIESDEVYRGPTKVNRKLVFMHKYTTNTSEDWLGCCFNSPDYEEYLTAEDLYRSMQA